MADKEAYDVWEVKHFLIDCAQTHPKAQAEDYVKHLYQSEFGGGHLIHDEAGALERLREEIEGLTEKQRNQPFFSPLCGEYCRINLSAAKELAPETIHRMFVNSSKDVTRAARFRFEEKLALFWELCKNQKAPFSFSQEQAVQYLKAYQEAGYPMVRHSEAYRKAYEPAYRVIRKEYERYLPLYSAVEKCLRKKGKVTVALDGSCAAGKSTAAQLFSELYDCNVFHADDFFLPPEKRTPERLAEVGGNMERERLRQEILEPLREGKSFSYQPFSCSEMVLKDPVRVEPKKINLIEGSYSMHPELREYYDVTAFLSVEHSLQTARILERNGSILLRRFLEEWVPKENAFFEQMHVREACDMEISC